MTTPPLAEIDECRHCGFTLLRAKATATWWHRVSRLVSCPDGLSLAEPAERCRHGFGPQWCGECGGEPAVGIGWMQRDDRVTIADRDGGLVIRHIAGPDKPTYVVPLPESQPHVADTGPFEYVVPVAYPTTPEIPEETTP